jgi:hypothetical protein
MAAGDRSGLGLVVSAIAGVPLRVEAGEPGAPPWTDGSVVFVDDALDPREQRRVACVQAALLAAGSLDREILVELGRRRVTARRYLAVEGHRALAASEALLPPVARDIIDPVMASRSTDPLGSLAVARGRGAIADPPAVFGTIRPPRVRAPRVPEAAADAAGHAPRPDRGRARRELDDGEDVDGDAVLDLFNPGGGGGALGRLLGRLLGTSRSRGDGAPGADAGTHRTAHAGRVARRAAVSTGRAVAVDDGPGPPRRGTTYPEWNAVDRRYRPDWCTVTEVEPDTAGAAPPRTADVHRLRRSLAHLGTERQRQHRQPQGDDIDIDATIAARVELLAGAPPDDAVYVDHRRIRRELSVLILLDVSGSSGEPSAAGGTVHEQQRAVAGALALALHDLGDRVALYGFRSQGRRAVRLVPVKRFRDRLDVPALGRLGGLVPGAYTRLGAAIRHGAALLDVEGGTARRLLIVLSDGLAYDHGYEGAYGEADARRALSEARRRGTACLCLSVGAGTDAGALRRVFGSVAHALVPGATQLSAVAGPLSRSALRLAERERRDVHRRARARRRTQVERSTA